MGYNSYPRSTTPKRTSATEPNKLKQALAVLGEVAQVKNTVTTVTKHITPANRNIIGGIGVAALLYWFYTAKSK